jgi:hypothetical protein
MTSWQPQIKQALLVTSQDVVTINNHYTITTRIQTTRIQTLRFNDGDHSNVNKLFISRWFHGLNVGPLLARFCLSLTRHIDYRLSVRQTECRQTAVDSEYKRHYTKPQQVKTEVGLIASRAETKLKTCYNARRAEAFDNSEMGQHDLLFLQNSISC